MFAKHTEAIRQGKAVKPTEFGKLVKGQEAESQFITAYQVCAERVPDGELWEPALERHEQLFGRSPRLATADAAFGRQRRGGEGAWGAPGGPARSRSVLGGAMGLPGPALVSARPTLAHRLRRADQCPETTAWAGPLSVPRSRRYGALAGAGRDCQ